MQSWAAHFRSMFDQAQVSLPTYPVRSAGSKMGAGAESAAHFHNGADG